MGLVVKLALAMALGAGSPGWSEGWSEGYAVRYAPGRMQQVAANRGIPVQPCMVAWTAARESDIGETWLWVEGPTGTRLRCLVVDLPETRDRPALVRRRILVELNFGSGADICGGRWAGKATECPVKVRIDD